MVCGYHAGVSHNRHIFGQRLHGIAYMGVVDRYATCAC